MPFDLQPIDVLLLVILALAALSGWRRGFAMVLLAFILLPMTIRRRNGRNGNGNGSRVSSS